MEENHGAGSFDFLERHGRILPKLFLDSPNAVPEPRSVVRLSVQRNAEPHRHEERSNDDNLAKEVFFKTFRSSSRL